MKHIIFSILYLIILFSLSTFVFDPTYLYYEIWWLDIPMHILAGFGLAYLTGAVLNYNKKKVSFWKLFVVYIVVATSWEVYEYFNNADLLIKWSGWQDTVKDLVDGFIGMCIVYYFIRK